LTPQRREARVAPSAVLQEQKYFSQPECSSAVWSEATGIKEINVFLPYHIPFATALND
jgi:hypothetical protein